MAQERSWRPADYWPAAVYLPPQTRALWEFEAPDDFGSAERARVRRESALGQQRTSRQNARIRQPGLTVELSGGAATIQSGRRRGAQQGSHQRSRSALPVTAWTIVAWVLACGLIAGIVAALVAVLVLHLA